MIVSIHQPYYFPWLGYFEKVLRADVFVFLDNDFYTKNNFYNRNRIKTGNGPGWLTVPVNKYKKDVNLLDITIAQNSKWQKKHFDSIYFNYKKAPFFDAHLPFFEELYKKNQWTKLIDLNLFTLNYFLEVLGVNCEIKYASELNIENTATERLVDICEAVGGDVYFSGSSGRNYMETELFDKKNIDVIYQSYDHPVYDQQYGEFVSNLSFIDLLLNYGPAAKDILLGEGS